MEAGSPKQKGNAITNRFSEGCTRWIPGDVGTENYVRNSSGLEPSLLELVRMRASWINGYLPVEGEYVMKMRSTQRGDR